MQDAPIDVHLDTSEPLASETASEPPRYPVDAGAIGPAFGPAADQVETALAIAIHRASLAARWDVVTQLARELEARRLGRAKRMVSLRTHRGTQ